MPTESTRLEPQPLTREKNSSGAAAVILLFSEEHSQYSRMALTLHAIGYTMFYISSKQALNDFISDGPTFNFARLDLTTFGVPDLPFLDRLAKRVTGNGLILWSSRTARPDVDAYLDSFYTGVFVRAEH
jgi:hypothetical protein